MYKLFLDDLRNPLGVSLFSNNPIYKLKDWVIVRNYNSFINIIIKNGIPEIISFDHDLGDFDENGQEKTGYDCAKWLVNYCMDNDLEFPEYFVHSWNGIGSNNIIKYIENFKKNR